MRGDHDIAAPSLEGLGRDGGWVAARHRSKIVLLPVSEVWAFEAKNRLSYVHCAYGKFAVDLSLREIESSPIGAGFIRVHRNWLASFESIREFALRAGLSCLFLGGLSDEEHTLRVPVARAASKHVRRCLLGGTIGVRKIPCG